ncbi:hypothetical protein EIN_162040 [Entamoeba invadens IP1]|uniref:TLDc domain-containing protein n=1 Tax=Entamoeba invadens IP1 TaxID=370355 RepID=A0A0A1U4E5_ENTIV|nr:hypothetical protein EIN_162040 [Entamoeba invadens IP1]ELP86570.1 hypothetical protein EIN_162040 [Entamoeba invadens IP1]|eukprot:XP_004185916.1 hypothetical protein EIN_162040 [Entamoeba invadens IP1]
MEVIDGVLSKITDDQVITGKVLKQLITPITLVLSTLSIRQSALDHSKIPPKIAFESPYPTPTNFANYSKLKEFEDEKLTQKMKSWISSTKGHVLYDTETDEWNSDLLKKQTLGAIKTSFYVFSDQNDIFGYYCKYVDKPDECDFVFSIQRHGKVVNKMFKRKSSGKSGLCIGGGNVLFKTEAFAVQSIRERQASWIELDLEKKFVDLKEKYLSKCKYPSFFETKRVIVVKWV